MRLQFTFTHAELAAIMWVGYKLRDIGSSIEHIYWKTALELVSAPTFPSEDHFQESRYSVAIQLYKQRVIPMANMRRPNPQEMRILQTLLSYPFVGHKRILKQIESCLVTELDANGSLAFEVDDDLKVAEIAQRIPVEAEYTDSDKIMCHIFIYIVYWKINELQKYKENLDTISTKYLEPIQLDIFRMIKQKDQNDMHSGLMVKPELMKA